MILYLILKEWKTWWCSLIGETTGFCFDKRTTGFNEGI